jgi:RNA polymerase sigma-70 factor (ECF subfamily)
MKSQKGEPVAAANAVSPSTEFLTHAFGEHHRRLLVAAYRITGSVADAEDVTQAIFLRLASIDRPVENLGSYLYRAAINGALDLLRRRKTAATEPLDQLSAFALTSPVRSPEAAFSSKELGDLLRVAISELAPVAAEMFTMRYIEELGNREIAALMGTSQAVVAVTLFHARKTLKRRLIELDGKINEDK